MSETIKFRPAQAGKRRQFTVQQKRALLLAAEAPGASISTIARQHGLQASMMFQWRKAMSDGEEKGLESGEEVVPVSKLRQAEARIKELERALGRKTMDVEILTETVRIAREKKLISPGKLPKPGGGK